MFNKDLTFFVKLCLFQELIYCLLQNVSGMNQTKLAKKLNFKAKRILRKIIVALKLQSVLFV